MNSQLHEHEPNRPFRSLGKENSVFVFVFVAREPYMRHAIFTILICYRLIESLSLNCNSNSFLMLKQGGRLHYLPQRTSTRGFLIRSVCSFTILFAPHAGVSIVGPIHTNLSRPVMNH